MECEKTVEPMTVGSVWTSQILVEEIINIEAMLPTEKV